MKIFKVLVEFQRMKRKFYMLHWVSETIRFNLRQGRNKPSGTGLALT